MATLGAIGQQMGLGDLGTIGSIALALASDPHMLLAAASLVPGLGSLAAAMDMALYLYEGDNVNAALAAAALIPGGAILAVGAGKGIKALVTMARAGAPGLRAAIGCSRVVQGLGRAGGAVSRVVRSVRTRISRLIGKTDDLASHADDVDSWRVPGSVPETGRVIHGADNGIAAVDGFGGLSKAAEYGIDSYKSLRGKIAGAGLEAHHLIEQRFAKVLNLNPREMLSIAVTKTEHQAFTNAWRREIGYGAGTAEATKESIEAAARRVYEGRPDILKALGL